MKLPKLTAVIEPGEDGWYVANCPELGIVSQGETPEHAEEMIKEAVELWLECADESEVRRRLEERNNARRNTSRRCSLNGMFVFGRCITFPRCSTCWFRYAPRQKPAAADLSSLTPFAVESPLSGW